MAPQISLVVEPHDDTRALYAEFLRHAGWETLEASDGGAALALTLAQSPQLLITELRLPRIDGLSLIDILKRDPKTSSIAIIVATADARRTAIDSARRAGADAVFPKPVDLDLLAGRLEMLKCRHVVRANALRARLDDVIAETEATIRRTKALTKAMGRYSTATPPAPPPSPVCTNCDAALIYQRSYVGGVNQQHREQWDYFECPNGCGHFQYRQRTRKIRRVP